MELPFKPFKPFDEMTADDYAEIGLQAGLEVHQQLLTETKLFCRCPAGRYSNEYDAEILRHMRPTLSELGEYDGTALMEKKTRKNIYYRLNHETVCTYEFDDTPPFMLNDKALDIALELAMLLRLNMVSELHIARKQYLDGSIPTGFQRTTIVGVSGWFPYKDNRKISVRQLGLEEDSCREVSDNGHDRVYIADRLGMPLIEVVTEPDMRTPQEVAEVGQIIRKLCRSTGKVRTGYGACRQDVNVSVRGGTRIEIKGVPQLWRIPHLIYNEAMRQCALLNIKTILKNRGITEESFKTKTEDVTDVVARKGYLPLRDVVSRGLRVKCVLLYGFAGILNEQTQEHTTFVKEFSDRVRVIACLTELPNIIHSGSGSDILTSWDWSDLGKKMHAGDNDALILVWGDERDTRQACEEIIIRAKEATVGVPGDTRQGLKDGTNGFERVLPGAERMYPDTDLPPISIGSERLARIRAGLPEFVWERESRYRDMGLADYVLDELCISPRVELFDRIVGKLNVSPILAGIVLVQRLKALQRAGLEPQQLSDDELFEIFRAHAEDRLASEGIIVVIERLLRQTDICEDAADIKVQTALDDLRIYPISDDELVEKFDDICEQHDEEVFPTIIKRQRYLMGCLMDDLAGCIAGRILCEKLNDYLGINDTQGIQFKVTN